MLSDEEFINQSITLNLFYLSNIRGFCINITLSFLDDYCVNNAKKFVFRTEEILNSFIDEITGHVPIFALQSNFIITDYTLKCEYLTEKLFDIDLDTSITTQLQLLKTLPIKSNNKSLYNLMTDVNKNTFNLATEYIKFLTVIFNREINNELFSYSTPFLTRGVINLVTMHKDMLNRTIKKMAVSPTYITDYEFKMNEIMKLIAILIAARVDPSHEKIYIKANSFAIEFQVNKVNYINKDLSFEDQMNITKKLKRTMIRFSEFLEDIIIDVLNSKAYFIIEPIFLDDFYRMVNYAIYNVALIELNY